MDTRDSLAREMAAAFAALRIARITSSPYWHTYFEMWLDERVASRFFDETDTRNVAFDLRRGYEPLRQRVVAYIVAQRARRNGTEASPC